MCGFNEGGYQKYINKYKFDIVLISANWVDGRKYYTDRQMVENIKHSVSILNAHSKHVFVLGQTKVFDTPFYRIALSGDPAKILRHELIELKYFNDYLVNIFHEGDVNYINSYDSECVNGNCRYISSDNYPLMFDNNHFTLPWSRLIMKNISIATPGVEK
ncbi:SGNH hydrolase domain-containing protein [Escherichia coli]